ncbi:MAG: YjjG family noncanonical pyrimidine nucleotidase [Bacteroidota bacterium]
MFNLPVVHELQTGAKLYFCADNMIPASKYSCIFFDLDRTLWDYDTNSAAVLKEIFSNFSLDRFFSSEQDFLRTFEIHNDRLWDEYRKGRMNKEILRNLRFELTLRERDISDPELSEKIGDYYLGRSTEMNLLFPGTFDILNYLKDKGYRLFILTNGFRQTQIGKLTNSGIISYFERMFTSEEIGYNKPNREIFHWAVTSLNARKKECLMIGDDNKVDIEGAAAYGIDAVWFNPLKVESATRAILTITSLDGLQELL